MKCSKGEDELSALFMLPGKQTSFQLQVIGEKLLSFLLLIERLIFFEAYVS